MSDTPSHLEKSCDILASFPRALRVGIALLMMSGCTPQMQREFADFRGNIVRDTAQVYKAGSAITARGLEGFQACEAAGWVELMETYRRVEIRFAGHTDVHAAIHAAMVDGLPLADEKLERVITVKLLREVFPTERLFTDFATFDDVTVSMDIGVPTVCGHATKGGKRWLAPLRRVPLDGGVLSLGMAAVNNGYDLIEAYDPVATVNTIAERVGTPSPDTNLVGRHAFDTIAAPMGRVLSWYAQLFDDVDVGEMVRAQDDAIGYEIVGLDIGRAGAGRRDARFTFGTRDGGNTSPPPPPSSVRAAPSSHPPHSPSVGGRVTIQTFATRDARKAEVERGRLAQTMPDGEAFVTSSSDGLYRVRAKLIAQDSRAACTAVVAAGHACVPVR